MNEDKITVVVPIYNVEKYLKKCIESILNQTYDNLEILLIDDGSTDNCLKICNDFKKKDSRIKVIKKENGGLSDARNYGINAATGKYIFFIDSDDYVSCDIIEYLHKILIDNKADISTCLYQPFYEDDKEVKSITGNYYVYDTIKGLENLLYQKNCTTSAWGKLYKTKLFKDIRYPKGKICEDLPTTYKLFSKAKKIVISDSKKYFYLQRANSIINSKFNIKRAEAMKFASEETSYILKNYPSLKNAAINREFMESVYIILSLKDDKEFINERKDANNIIKKYRKTVIFDKDASKKSKLYAIISYAGIKNIYNIKKLLSR